MYDLLTMIWKELIQISNRSRFALQKTIVAIVLAGALVLMAFGEIYNRPGATYQMIASFGRNTFLVLSAIISIVLPLTAMVFGCDIVVSEHVRKRLPLLLVTPLAGPAIMGSKVISVFGRVVVGLLVALPVVAMLQIFGGVDRTMVIASTVFILSNVWLCGSLGLMMSVLCRSTVSALARSAICVLVWNLIPLLALVLVEMTSSYARYAGGAPSFYNQLAQYAFAISPFYIFYGIAYTFGPLSPLIQAMTIHTSVNLAGGAMFLGVAFLAFRPVAMRLVSGAPVAKRGFLARRKEAKKAKATSKGAYLGRVAGRFDNSVLDKETARWRPFRISAGLVWLFVPWAVMFLFSGFNSSYPDLTNAENHWPLFVFEVAGLLFLLSVMAATRISREKEARTLQVLVLTRLGAARILVGKALALVLDQALPIALLAAHLAFITWIEVPSPIDVAVRLAALITCILFAVMIGLYYSLSCKSTVGAVVLTALTWFLGVYAGMLPAMMLQDFFGARSSEISLVGAGFPLVVALVFFMLLTVVRSRKRGFGAWLSVASYASLSATVYVGVISSLESSATFASTAGLLLLPGASLVAWEGKVSGLNLAYVLLPVQISILAWMIASFLVSFETQAKREA